MTELGFIIKFHEVPTVQCLLVSNMHKMGIYSHFIADKIEAKNLRVILSKYYHYIEIVPPE